MTRLIMILSFLLMAMTTTAQTGLHVDDVFRGNIIDKEKMIEVKVSGKTLSRYKLSFYHTVKFSATPEQETMVEKLLLQDEPTAIDRYSYRHGANETSIYQLPPSRGHQRFLCRVKSVKRETTTITLVYLEGKVKDIKTLKQLINK